MYAIYKFSNFIALMRFITKELNDRYKVYYNNALKLVETFFEKLQNV